MNNCRVGSSPLAYARIATKIAIADRLPTIASALLEKPNSRIIHLQFCSSHLAFASSRIASSSSPLCQTILGDDRPDLLAGYFSGFRSASIVGISSDTVG